jgi:foldase protein PrsA
MKRLKLTLALGAFFVAAIVSGCGSGVPGNSVADMAGNPITVQAFNHWMYVAAKGQAAQTPGAPIVVASDPPEFKSCIAQIRKQVPTLAKTSSSQLKSTCQQLFTSLGSQVMDFLIKAYWYQAEAAKLHVKVSDSQVQQAFNQAKQQQFPTASAFQTFLQQSGQTLDDILFRFRIDQILRALIAKHSTTVTPAQIQAYYSSHLSQFGTPESRDLRIVRTNSASQAQAAKSALQSGQSWTQVAKRYSVDASTKNKGGLLSGVTRGQEEKTLDTAAFAASLNKLQGPVHGTFGYYVFEVTKIKKSTQQTLARATPLIKQILSGQSQNNAQSAVDAQAKKDWLKKTDCLSAYAMADCNGYKPPKTSTTTTPGQPSTSQTPTTTTGP